MGILNQKSKLELTTKLSTEASVDLPFYQRERIRDHKMNQIPVHDTEGFSENDTDDHSEESETDESERDEIKARFDKRLKILKRACSVLPQLRGANDLASHNQLIRLGFTSFMIVFGPGLRGRGHRSAPGPASNCLLIKPKKNSRFGSRSDRE